MVGDRAKALRLEKKLSLSEVAAAGDMERSDVSRVERGTHNVTLATLTKYCNGLGITFQEFANFK